MTEALHMHSFVFLQSLSGELLQNHFHSVAQRVTWAPQECHLKFCATIRVTFIMETQEIPRVTFDASHSMRVLEERHSHSVFSRVPPQESHSGSVASRLGSLHLKCLARVSCFPGCNMFIPMTFLHVCVLARVCTLMVFSLFCLFSKCLFVVFFCFLQLSSSLFLGKFSPMLEPLCCWSSVSFSWKKLRSQDWGLALSRTVVWAVEQIALEGSAAWKILRVKPQEHNGSDLLGINESKD